MSFIDSFPRIKITSVTTSWTRDISFTTFRAVPAGSTFAIMEFASGTSGTTFGIQDADSTEDFVSASYGRTSFFKFIPINATRTFDAILGNTSFADINLMAYTSHITAVSIDKSSVITSANTFTVTMSELPSNAANGFVVLQVVKAQRYGAVGATTNMVPFFLPPRAHIVVPLNASKQFEVKNGGAAFVAGDLMVIGWGESNAYLPDAVNSLTTGGVTLNTTGAYTQVGASSPTDFDFYHLSTSSSNASGGSASVLKGIRTSGDVYNVQNQNTTYSPHYVKNSTGGQIDGYTNTAGLKFYRMGGFVADTAAANISSVDTFTAGATATVVFNKSVSSVTKIRATCAVMMPDGITPIDTHYVDITSFSGSGTTWTFTVPAPTNNADGIRLGAVKLSPTTNTGTGADFTGLTYSKTGYMPVSIEDVLPLNVCEGDIPALVTNDQIAWNSALIGVGAGVDVHGMYSDPRLPTDSPPFYAGTQTMWHYAADFKWYSFDITTSSPTPPVLTAGNAHYIGYGIGVSF